MKYYKSKSESWQLHLDWERAKEFLGDSGMLEEVEKWLSNDLKREIIQDIDSEHDIFEV